jgi:hypothetical protein
MKKMLSLLATLITLAAFTPSLFADAPPLPSAKWQNQNKTPSTLTITDYDGKTGMIKGTYVSPEGTSGDPYPLVGWINVLTTKDKNGKETKSTQISWTVNWKEFGSLTSWTGSLEGDANNPTIVTMWHLVSPNVAFPWMRILTNQDRFTPVLDPKR